MDGAGSIRAVVFDAYGTLFDVHAPAARLADRIGADAAAFSETWRRKQLEYTWLRSLMGVYAPFDQVTRDALAYAFEAHGLSDEALRRELLELYATPDAYGDAARALAELARRGLPAAILSNGGRDWLTTAARSAGLDFRPDRILSVEDVGIFKPAPEVYRLATDRFSCLPREILFVSSNGWDAAGAAQFGFRVVHVNRAGAPAERLPSAPHSTIPDLDALPDLSG
jgi:2-haloacid dehalogenase